jgi:uncharacterized integral membrane protein (TIGR00698 family)
MLGLAATPTISEPVVTSEASARASSGRGRGCGPIRSVVPGVLAAAAVAVVATKAARYVPLVGAPVLAIVIGLALSTFLPGRAILGPGLRLTARYVLQGSIVILGLGLSLRQVVSIGVGSLPVLVGTLLSALGMAWLAGRALRLRRDVTTLIGVGTAICGASAIAATDAVIDADETDVSYAITTIFLFNVVAVIAYPPLAHVAGLSQHAFGLFAGTAVNDTSSVVAATTVYGHQAAAYGLVVKLTRTLAIIPVCVALAAWRRGRVASVGTGPAWWHVLPVFLLGFLAAVGLNSAGLVPAHLHAGLSTTATWMITAALAAIGLSSRLGQLRNAGFRPICLGAILWATVGVSSLVLQILTGTL